MKIEVTIEKNSEAEKILKKFVGEKEALIKAAVAGKLTEHVQETEKKFSAPLSGHVPQG